MPSDFNRNMIETTRAALYGIILVAAGVGLIFGAKPFFSIPFSAAPMTSWDMVADWIGQASRVVFPLLVGVIAVDYFVLAGSGGRAEKPLQYKIWKQVKDVSALDRFIEYLGNVDRGHRVPSKKAR